MINRGKASLVALTCILLVGFVLPAFAAPGLVAVIGDSLSVGENSSYTGSRPGYGNGSTSSQYYPSHRLSDLLNGSSRTSVAVNWGVGGSASGGASHNTGVARISGALSSSRNSYPNNTSRHVLIIYGTNDEGYGLMPSTTGANIGIMIDRTRAAGFVPVVGSIPPTNPAHNNTITQRNYYIKTTAAGRGAVFIDHYSGFSSSLIDTDTVHPSNAGYSRIANNWYDGYLKNAIDVVISLTSIRIIGVAVIEKESPSQYAVKATFSDGSTSIVGTGVTWSEDSANASITQNGLLTSQRVKSDKLLNVTASYSHNGITETTSLPVTLAARNVNIVPMLYQLLIKDD